MNTQVIRGITKVIGTTLVKFKDKQSQQLVQKLIVDLTKQHPDLSLEHFNSVFKSFCTKELINAPPAKASAAAAIAFTWSNSIALNCNKTSPEFVKLMEYQSLLFSLAMQSSEDKVIEKVFSFFKTFWNELDDKTKQKYFDKFLSMEPTYNVIVFLSAMLRFNRDEKCDNTLLEDNKAKLLDIFVKSLITVKMKPNHYHIRACKNFLATITKDEFKSTIFPALQRSMLRNPEIVLEGVGFIVQELTFDINESTVDLGKVLIQNLYSKNDASRIEAVNSLKEVAKKCSDVKSVETLMTQIFSVLGGSDGKITVAEYRINLLQVRRELNYNFYRNLINYNNFSFK
jgi:hypothetical protein